MLLQIPKPKMPGRLAAKSGRNSMRHHADQEIMPHERAALVEARNMLKRLPAPPREAWRQWIDINERGLVGPAVFETEMLLRSIERGAWALATGGAAAEVIAPALSLVALEVRVKLLHGAPAGSVISPVPGRILDALKGEPADVSAAVLSGEMIAAIAAARAMLRSGGDVVLPPLRPAVAGSP